MPDAEQISVTFKLFGPLVAMGGGHHVPVDLPAGSTVRDALDALIADRPDTRAGLEPAVVAADGVMVRHDACLHGGEELTVVTMVSGG